MADARSSPALRARSVESAARQGAQHENGATPDAHSTDARPLVTTRCHSELSAKVAPREITAGGTVSVQARLEGIGRLPTKLRLPERTGDDILDGGAPSRGAIRHGDASGILGREGGVQQTSGLERRLGRRRRRQHDDSAG